MTIPKYVVESESERVFNIVETFNQAAQDTQSKRNIQAENKETEKNEVESVLSMSSLGQLGRFGNQIFQYAFLRVCAHRSGASVECPFWIGQVLFGHHDPPISRRLPPAIERKVEGKALFDTAPEFIPYLEKLAGAKSCRINEEAIEQGLTNVDLWGFFQVPTRFLASDQHYIRALFQPVDDLKVCLEEGMKQLHARGRTVVGVHIRRGDYLIQVRTGFTLVVPESWYCEYLDKIWHDLEDPVLFICSDNLEEVLPAFEKYSPMTSQDLQLEIPERLQNMNIEFYIDFFVLSQCDIVIASNSIFSFAACLLNEHGQKFVRPHWDFSSKFADFDPWDSDPLLWIGHPQPRVFKSVPEILQTTYATQGLGATLKSLFIFMPKSYLKEWSLRIYLGYQIQGWLGAFKSMAFILKSSLITILQTVVSVFPFISRPLFRQKE